VPSPPSLDELLRAYVTSSSTTLEKIDVMLDELRTSFLLHKSDDEHALRQIHKRLEDLELAQEETTDHNLQTLQDKAKENEQARAKVFDVAIKVIGWAGALGIGWLAHHLFWK
jgi:hypothetical protein